MRVIRTRRVAVGIAAGLLVGGAAIFPSGSPATGEPVASSAAPSARPIDAAQAERLGRVAVPLIRAMSHPLDLDKVRVGFLDDDHVNAANAGHGEFLVTRGLLEKASDDQLRGVLAHELAHEDLGHVAKAQKVGTGLAVGIALLDRVIPGSAAVTPLAGKLILNRYTQKEEYAADRHGAEILQRAGFRRETMADTLTWLSQVEGGSGGGFFATHPATGDRIEALRAGR